MKKILSLLLAALLLATACLSFASCADQGKKLILGFDAEFPPYGYVDSETGAYVGFDLELAAIVCQNLGYTLETKPIDWNSKDADLASGAITCIWNGFTMNGRENDYAFTDAYIDSSIVVLVKSDSGITSIADLAGKTVEAQKGSSGEAAIVPDEEEDGEDYAAKKARYDGFKSYKTCTDYTIGLTDLESGACDALIIDKGVAVRLIKGKTNFTILTEAVTSEQYGVGFLKGQTAMAKEFSDALKAVDKETVYALADKYEIERGALLLW